MAGGDLGPMDRRTLKPMTFRMALSFVLAALVLALAGCNMPASDASADGAAPSRQSQWFDPADTFKDPQAQALARAAQDNNAEEVRHLIKDEHVNPDTLFGNDGYEENCLPLVAWPVLTHSLGGLKALLDNGANPNARSPKTHVESVGNDSATLYNCNNAMVYAAMNEDPAYLTLLLAHGGDPNTLNTNEETLLFQAKIWHNQWQNVQVLVEHGADVNYAANGGSILYHYASFGDFKAAYWLLQHGADPKVDMRTPPDSEAFNPAIEAIFWYPDKPNMRDWKRQCQQWLLAHGFKRPPLPQEYRDMRKILGQPYDEKDIPLL